MPHERAACNLSITRLQVKTDQNRTTTTTTNINYNQTSLFFINFFQNQNQEDGRNYLLFD